MKNSIKLFALFAALCLLAGCSAGPDPAKPDGESEAAASLPAQTDAPAPSGTAPAQTEAPTDDDSPAQWVDERRDEYPVEDYQLADGAFAQSGSLNTYRYLQLDGAEVYMDLAADYVREALACGDALTMEENSPHDGYANWFMDAPNGSASVSGSRITGRFSFGLYPGFDRILEATASELADRDAMEQAAWSFVRRFSAITGELELLQAEEEPQYYHDERSSELRDVTVPAMRYTFRSRTVSECTPELQDGLSVPLLCGDSTIEDPRIHCFVVTVWPDGTVVRADNYITQAQLVPDGSVRMPDESDLPSILRYMTSYEEHDTILIEELCVESCSVYFGHADVEPLVTMRYRFASAPDELLTTTFSLGLLD